MALMTTDHVEDSDPILVMAMPRRELYGLQGFTTRMTMEVINAVSEDHWFATVDSIAADIDAKAVRLGLVVRCDGRALVDDNGVLVHATLIPPEVTSLGKGLASLRAFARLSAVELLRVEVPPPTLVGYLNDDRSPEARDCFLLVYQAVAPAQSSAPEGLAWVPFADLRHVGLDPTGAEVAAGLLWGE